MTGNGVHTVIDSPTFSRVVARIAHEILEHSSDPSGLVLIGIWQGGSLLKDRLVSEIESKEKIRPDSGDIDITFYRDDLFRIGGHPNVKKSEINVNLDGKTVVLIDDVLHTGRTVRAAIDALMDYGRPSKIQLAVMIDRGGRELPIQADFVGKKVSVGKGQVVSVKFAGVHGEDGVDLEEQTDGR